MLLRFLQIPIYLVKSSKVLDLSVFLTVPTLEYASLSLVFALMGENKGNFFQPPPTTLSNRRAEERFASLVAWA